MQFRMSPGCREALTAMVAGVTIVAALLALFTFGIDARIAAATASLRQDLEVTKVQVMHTREDIGRVERGVQTGFASLERQLGWVGDQMRAR